MHEGLKPHVCDICQETFAQKSNMNEHIARKHNNITHTCDYCDKTFNTKTNLYRHVKSVHNV